MATLVESYFYADPPIAEDAPKMGRPSGQSRAIDIFAVLNPTAPPRISYVSSGWVTTASQLETAIRQPLLNPPVV